MGSLLGKSVTPTPENPGVGVNNQNNFFNALFNNSLTQKPDGGWDFKPVPSFPGSLSPDVSQTRLPDVASNWQPWNTGTEYMANALFGSQQHGGLGIGTPDPNLKMLMDAGQGGTGNRAVDRQRNYGVSSDQPNGIGTWMHSLAQYGAPSAVGKPLGDIANGYATGMAAWLNPFLNSNARVPYKAPNVTLAPVTGGV